MFEAVEDILKSADPVEGIRVRDIAERIGIQRDGPTVPFSGRRKNQLQSNVNSVLRRMRDRGEAKQIKRGRGSSASTWGVISGPTGSPKPEGWTGSGRPGQGRRSDIKQPEGHEPVRPVSSAEQRRKADRRKRDADRSNPENWGANSGRDDMAPESDRNKRARDRSNPENWGANNPDRKGGKKKGRTGDPSTWGHAAEKDEKPKGRTGDPSTWGHAAEKNKGGDDEPKGDGTNWRDYL